MLSTTETSLPLDEVSSNTSETRQPPSGILIMSKIVDHPNEGLVIRWARHDLLPTMIEAVGIEGPLYAYVKKLFPDFSKIAGVPISINTDEHGLIISLGIPGQPLLSL